MENFLNDYIRFISTILIFLIMILSFLALCINSGDGIHIIVVLILYSFIVICCKINYGNIFTQNIPILNYTQESEPNQNLNTSRTWSNELQKQVSIDCQ